MGFYGFKSKVGLTETDSFFRYLFALGSVSKTIVKRFWVYDPLEDVIVEKRFRDLIGQALGDCFSFKRNTFQELLGDVSNIIF